MLMVLMLMVSCRIDAELIDADGIDADGIDANDIDADGMVLGMKWLGTAKNRQTQFLIAQPLAAQDIDFVLSGLSGSE